MFGKMRCRSVSFRSKISGEWGACFVRSPFLILMMMFVRMIGIWIYMMRKMIHSFL